MEVYMSALAAASLVTTSNANAIGFMLIAILADEGQP